MKKLNLLLYIFIVLFSGCIHNSEYLNYPGEIKPEINNPNAVLVSNLLFNIKPNTSKWFYFKFAPGDTIVINSWTIKGDNISNFNILRWPNSEIFSTSAVKIIRNERIVNERVAIYRFKISNTSLFSTKMYKLMIYRIPKYKAFARFNTTVYWDTLYDTTFVTQKESVLVSVDTAIEKVLDSKIEMPYMKKSYIEVNLPKHTLFWVYWIGAFGTGNKNESSSTEDGLNIPLRSFALGKIKKIVGNGRGATIDYYFIKRQRDVDDFMSGLDFYSFKKGLGIVSDYGKIEEPLEGRFFIAVKNSDFKKRREMVRFKILALVGIPHYEYDYITVPRVRRRFVPRI